MSSKLFVFSRPLPAPFDKAKKKVKVSSKYGDGTEATLCSTVVKAVQAYFKCKYKGFKIVPYCPRCGI